jgi:hypothetical protein
MGTIICCETLAYFQYTPVKAKIKITTNTHFCDLFWGCHQLQQFLFPYSPFYTTLHVVGIIAFKKKDFVYFTWGWL